MHRKPKTDVRVLKTGNGKYCVRTMTFDCDGRTVDHRFIGNDLSFREAHALKREALSV